MIRVPGIRPILGKVIATEIDGVKRFVLADKHCAYAGLVPSTQRSGDKTYHGRALSACNKWLRAEDRILRCVHKRHEEKCDQSISARSGRETDPLPVFALP